MLSPNATDIAQRLNETKARDLPFDGMFSQLGEVFFKIKNLNASHNLTVGVPLTYAPPAHHSTHSKATCSVAVHPPPAARYSMIQGPVGWSRYDHAIERGYRSHLNGTSFRTPFDINLGPGQQTGWCEYQIVPTQIYILI